MTHILLVEDNLNLHEGIKLNLELEGYKVFSAYNGLEGIKTLKDTKIDLIITDIMMPEMDGFNMVSTLKLSHPNTPVIFLSARDMVEDKIKGLELGADDYLTKPFNLKELLLRVKMILRRVGNEDSSVVESYYQVGDYHLDVEKFSLRNSITEQDFELTQKQSKLLQLLITKRGKVVSRKEILEKIWEYEIIPNTRTIDNVILSLRKLLGEESNKIKSIRGVGYKLEE